MAKATSCGQRLARVDSLIVYAGGIRPAREKFGGCEPLADATLYTP